MILRHSVANTTSLQHCIAFRRKSQHFQTRQSASGRLHCHCTAAAEPKYPHSGSSRRSVLSVIALGTISGLGSCVLLLCCLLTACCEGIAPSARCVSQVDKGTNSCAYAGNLVSLADRLTVLLPWHSGLLRSWSSFCGRAAERINARISALAVTVAVQPFRCCEHTMQPHPLLVSVSAGSQIIVQCFYCRI